MLVSSAALFSIFEFLASLRYASRLPTDALKRGRQRFGVFRVLTFEMPENELNFTCVLNIQPQETAEIYLVDRQSEKNALFV